MKEMKKYILLLTLPVVCAMSAWAQVTVTQTAANQWQFGMPAGDVEVRIAYSDIAAFSTEPAAVTGLVYTGAAQELITAGASDEGTLYYRLGTDGTWLTTLPTGTEVGSYSVYYYIAGDANHNDSEVAGPIAVSIEKGTPAFTTLPAVIPGGLPFTGEAQTLVTAGTATAGTIEYSLDEISWSADLPTAVNIGAYSVYYRIRGNANYNDVPAAGPLTAGIINPLPVEVAVGTDGAYAFTKPAYDIEIEVEYYDDAFFPTGGEPKAVPSLVYSGTPQALVTAGVVVGGTMEYSLDDIIWSTDIPQVTDAGDYTVSYRVVGDATHGSLAPVAIATGISKKELTVTADDFTIAYGEAAPVYTAVYTGWQGADDASVLTTPVAFACAYTQGSAVGTYSITPNSAVAANYAITFVPGTLTVQSKSSSTSADITAFQTTGEELVYNGARNKPTVTVKDGTTPLTEGVDYTLTYKGQAAGGYAESTDAPIEAGAYYAVVTLAGNYSGTLLAGFTIQKALLTVTADDYTIAYGEAAPAYSAVYTGWQGADDASVLTTPVAFACAYTQGSAVGTYSITPNSAVAANYAITFVPGTLTVQSKSSSTSADITATQATGEQLVYNGTRNKPTVVVKDGTTPLTEGVDYTLTYKGQAAGGYAESTDAPIEVGDYYAVVTLAGNYSGIMHAAFTIAKAPLTVTADDYTIAYGEAAPAYSAVYAGWQGADDASVLTAPVAFACAYTQGSAVGTYSITPNSAVAANYAITYVPGTLTVQSKSSSTSADITATQATGEQLVYNGTRNKPTVVVKDGTTPLTEGVDYTLTYKGQAAGGYAESAYAPIDAGAYYAVVTLTGNYSGTTQASFTIQKAPLTVTADNFTISYGEAAPAYSVVYTGWQGADDASVLLAPVSLTCAYTQGNAVGTYPITLNSAIAANYVITFVPGTLTVTPVVVSVTGVDVEVAKFADGTTDAVITSVGSLQGVYSSDAVSHTVTAAFSDAAAGEHKTITLTYTLTGDAVQMANYILTPASEVYTTEGVILEPIVPSTDPVTREGVLLYGGVEVNAYGYCDGEDYSLSYHLSSGLPDQYKIDYADGRFSDVGWTYLSTPGSDGMIEIEVPADMPTGDYTFAVTFRDSRFTHLESDPCLVTIHVNLPESYVTALMGNVIVLIDTCKCFTDVQWFHRSSSTDVWQAIPGATDYYYKEEGGLTGEYFVRVRMDGVETFTCPQTDVETLYDPANRPAAAKVSVHPNPVQTTATVTIEDSQTEDHTLRIVSMNGWEVENRSFDGNTTTIDMSGCQVGNYMISVDGIVVKVIKK